LFRGGLDYSRSEAKQDGGRRREGKRKGMNHGPRGERLGGGERIEEMRRNGLGETKRKLLVHYARTD
jgi:hypothetical protein